MSVTAIPGQLLGSTSTKLSGPGTHVFESKIYASIVGPVITTRPQSKTGKPSISIPRDASAPRTQQNQNNSTLPMVGSVVLCRITKVQQRQAIASILVTDPSSAAAGIPYAAATNDELQFQAVLRREDVRGYEKDKVVMNEMFRIADIVRASVISIGDERSYYISTAGNDFGVVVAESDDGNAMAPVSWKEMRDSVTGKGETRKVAKPA